MVTNSPTIADILRIFGTIDDHKALELMGLNPSFEDLGIAKAYLADMTDVMGEERRPLAGNAAKIYEIVIRDEFFDEEESGAR